MNVAPCIAVIDSGVGGLTVLQSIRSLLPQLSYVFCADNLRFPYGPKPEAEVNAAIADVARRVVHAHKVDLLVVACGTASTIVLPQLRVMLTCPVVGVVPAIKPAALLTRTKNIGLLATPGTVLRSYTDKLIEDFATPLGVNVVKIGTSRLVEMAEAKGRGEGLDLDELARIVEPFTDAQVPIDTVVLGCTHFPLLTSELQRVAPYVQSWVDSGEAIARRCKELLPQWEASSPSSLHFCVTRLDEAAHKLRPFLKGFGFDQVTALPALSAGGRTSQSG